MSGFVDHTQEINQKLEQAMFVGLLARIRRHGAREDGDRL